MKRLSEERIREMRQIRDKLIANYSARDAMLKRYEEIYFMTRGEKPRGLKGVDDDDIKETISSSGRDAVTGMKRILDSGEVHVKVHGAADSDKIERGLKQMLKVSGQYRIASVEKDLNLSASLYGPSVMTVDLVDDLIEAVGGGKSEEDSYSISDEGKKGKNEYVTKQLEMLRKKTPFLFHTINPPQSYPMWGSYGMVGHARQYKLKGAEIADRFGHECDPNKAYEIKDFFYYTDRLVEADGINEPLLAAEWVARGEDGEIIGSINIPVFTRYAGGTSLFHEPDRQSQPLLYAKAQGNWDLRENLYYTYLFTAIYQQGLPGPLAVVKPDSNTEIEVEYRKGLRTVVMDGQLTDTQVIDGDVMQLGQILEKQAATQTIQPQTLGQNTAGVTFSQFAMASKAGLIPAIDPKESQEALYEDAFTHVLQRIKEEGIENDLISPQDIPESFELEVTIEPDLEQDDLRNAQVAIQLRNAQVGSREWIETNILKIADSKRMWRERKLEELSDAMVELMKSPEVMQQFMAKALRLKPQGNGGQGGDQTAVPGGGQGGDQAAVSGELPGGEQMPKTDAMVPPEERQ